MRQSVKHLAQLGFSLIEIVVAMAGASLLALGVAYVSVDMTNSSNKMTSKNEMERLHYVALQKARNMAYLSKVMNLVNADGSRVDAALDQCLSGRGSGCAAKSKSWAELPEGRLVSPMSSGQTISTNLEARIICSSDNACEKISITASTKEAPHAAGEGTAGNQDGRSLASFTTPLKAKSTTTEFSGTAFAPLSQIGFACSDSGGQILRSVDLTDRSTSCDWILPPSGGTNCATNGPMSKFGAQLGCQTLENKDCATTGNGIGQVGIFTGHTVCRTIAADSGQPLPTPTATPTPSSPTPTPTPTPPSCPVVVTCFVAGTKVQLANGDSKSIEAVEVGDLVATFDELTGLRTVSPVKEVQHHDAKESVLFTFHFEDGPPVTSNDVHYFYLPRSGRYQRARDMFKAFEGGQSIELLGSSGQIRTVTNIERSVKTEPLFNLHVVSAYDSGATDGKFGHNYFAEGVLVHNLKILDDVTRGSDCCSIVGGVETSPNSFATSMCSGLCTSQQVADFDSCRWENKCIGGGVSWSQGAATCSGTLPTSAMGASEAVVDSTAPTVGSATYNCYQANPGQAPMWFRPDPPTCTTSAPSPSPSPVACGAQLYRNEVAAGIDGDGNHYMGSTTVFWCPYPSMYMFKQLPKTAGKDNWMCGRCGPGSDPAAPTCLDNPACDPAAY